MPPFKSKSFWLAIVVTLLCSLLGTWLKLFPGLNLVGALVLALLLGMLVQFIPSVRSYTAKGSSYISGKFLRLGIILLGFKLNLPLLMESGIRTLVLALGTVIVMIVIYQFILYRLFRNKKELALLTATGCSICGAAAVMGMSPILESEKDDTILAVAVVCIMGTLFTLVEVGLFQSGFLVLTPVQYGVMAGTSLHEIAHAVAAGNAGGSVAESAAILSKLSRVLMLVPVALVGNVFALRYLGKEKKVEQQNKIPIPWFMLGFVLTSAAGSYLPILSSAVPYLVDLAYLILGMAMAALGLNVNFRVIQKEGGRLLAAACLGSVIQVLLAYISARWLF